MITEDINSSVIQITINNLIIQTSDIVEFYFIEDMYMPVMMGALTFNDHDGVVEAMPITGNELIRVSFGEDREDRDKDLYFCIHSFNSSPSSQLGQSKDATVEMMLIDPIYYSLTLQKYSKSWIEGTKLSDIVKDIAKNILGVKKFFRWEDSLEKIGTGKGMVPAFIMQNSTPLEALKWIMQRCSGSVSRQPGYALYNTAKGLCFTSLETLFRTEKTEVDANRQKKFYRFVSTDDKDDCKILSWELSPPDKDALPKLKGGHKIGFDFTTKTIIDQTYDYKSALKGFTLLGGATLFPDISDTNTRYDLTGDNDATIMKNIGVHNFIRQYITQMQCEIIVRGHERRYPGMMVDIIWRSSNPDNVVNMELEGLWMVKGITHYFDLRSQPFYQQKMTLMTSAYSKSKSKYYMGTNVGGERKNLNTVIV